MYLTWQDIIIIGFIIILIKILPSLYRIYIFRKTINIIPGYVGLPFIGSIQFFRLINFNEDEFYRHFCERAKIYKDGIFKLWLGNLAMVYVFKPEYVKVVLSHSRNINKSPMYNSFKPWLGNGLITAGGLKWSHDRKMITPAFHFSLLDNFVGVMIEKTEILINRIKKELTKNPGNAIDVCPFLFDLGFDIICETAMGVNVHAQERKNIGYSDHVKMTTSAIMYRIKRPWLSFDRIFAMTNVGKQYFSSIDYLHRFDREVIRKKKETRSIKIKNDNEDNEFGTKKRKAFLDLLLDINEKDSCPMSDEEIREHVDSFMFAGHDTTSSAVSWALLLLGNNLEIQDKVYQEIKDVIEQLDKPINYQTISQMKYLERVCKEVLRFIPVVSTYSRTVTEEVMLDKYLIPKGTILSVHIHGLHNNPKVWKNPEIFDPDRFLPEQSQNRNPYAFVPFSAGPRNCIGQKFAYLVMKLILVMLLQKWKVKSLLSQDNVKKQMVITLQPLEGLDLYFTPR